jgi:hypothetical protein
MPRKRTPMTDHQIRRALLACAALKVYTFPELMHIWSLHLLGKPPKNRADFALCEVLDSALAEVLGPDPTTTPRHVVAASTNTVLLHVMRAMMQIEDGPLVRPTPRKAAPRQ